MKKYKTLLEAFEDNAFQRCSKAEAYESQHMSEMHQGTSLGRDRVMAFIQKRPLRASTASFSTQKMRQEMITLDTVSLRKSSVRHRIFSSVRHPRQRKPTNVPSVTRASGGALI